MTEADERQCEQLLLARRVLSLLCFLANLAVVLAVAGSDPLMVLRAAWLAIAAVAAMLACDRRIVALQGRDRRRARA